MFISRLSLDNRYYGVQIKDQKENLQIIEIV